MRATRDLGLIGLLLSVAGCSQGLGDAGNESGRQPAQPEAAAAPDGGGSALGEAEAQSSDPSPQAAPSETDESAPNGDDASSAEPELETSGSATTSDTDAAEPEPDSDLPGVVVVPRLTQAELSHVLQDVLGDQAQAPIQFLSEDEFSPYDNDATRQTVSGALIDSLLALAEDVAQRVAHDSTLRAGFMPCEPESATDAACFDQTARSLARVLLRREIEDSEVDAYRSLLAFGEEQGDFYAALELLLTALIQDPEFLYRIERGIEGSADSAALQLSGNEIATRMAFLLWGSTPSPAVLDAAASLPDANERRVLASAMLQDQRARQQLYRFHAMWLGYRALPHDAELNAAFQSETEHLIERVVFTSPSDYVDLFSSPETHLTTALAEHYGLPAPDGGEGWVTYPQSSERAGILSHGSVLSSFSKFSDTSPTQRGILVRTRLLCLPVPPPPPSVNVDQAPGENSGECKTDRYRAHREQSGCADCHNQFEPIGMGLENFDRAGRYREHDDDNESCPILGQGSLPGYGDFSGPRQLSELLVEAGVIDDCMVHQYLAFASSKSKLNAADEAHAAALVETLSAHDNRLGEWLVEFVADDAFAQRARQEGQ